MIVRYRSRALADIDQIYRYIHTFSSSGANNVLKAIYAGVHLAGVKPYACEQTDNPDVRVKIVNRYRYKIFFSVIGNDTVEILHIRHMSRRPWVGER